MSSDSSFPISEHSLIFSVLHRGLYYVDLNFHTNHNSKAFCRMGTVIHQCPQHKLRFVHANSHVCSQEVSCSSWHPYKPSDKSAKISFHSVFYFSLFLFFLISLKSCPCILQIYKCPDIAEPGVDCINLHSFPCRCSLAKCDMPFITQTGFYNTEYQGFVTG